MDLVYCFTWPSLLFPVVTLGSATPFLWVPDSRTFLFLQPALLIGKVPMSYYVLHVPLIHLLAFIVCLARYGQVHWTFESPGLRTALSEALDSALPAPRPLDGPTKSH